MNITPTVVLNYESKKTPGDMYQIVLTSLDQMVQAVDNDVNNLNDIRAKAMEVLATVDNRLYRLSGSFSHHIAKTTTRPEII